MKIAMLAVFALVLFSLISPVSGATPAAASSTVDAAGTYAKQERLHRDHIAFIVAPIRSRAELVRYVKETPATLSPLNRLSPSARARFLESLTFGKRGLSGYRYADLARELTPVQIYQILSLFGRQHGSPAYAVTPAYSSVDEAIRIDGLPSDEDNCMAGYRCTGYSCIESHGDICCLGDC